MKAEIFGRAWFFETGDNPEIECFEYKLAPTEISKRSGAEWAREHFLECYDERQLRELFGVPPTGNFQVLFKGTLRGFRCGPWEAPDSEWDEEFDLDESQSEPIHEDYMQFWRNDK